jgi:ABC-type multidrug transport system ATPase subunit
VSSRSPLLAARGVARSFGAQVALEATELEVWDGEALALVGPNGAGKSTLLSIMAGAVEPSAGRVERGSAVRVGWSPQRPGHYARLSARENLELFARLEGAPEPDAAAARLLEEFDLPPIAAPSANLSVGNRQRLNLALAQLGTPDVLLLDEPTASLDPDQRRRLWARTAALRERGGAVVFATQNLDEVERNAERVVALRAGKVVFDGAVDDYERSEEALIA